MTDIDPFEPGTHNFSGTIRAWGASTAELITDSGLVVFLDTRGREAIPVGTRIAIVTRKYRPCHLVTQVTLK